MTRETTAHIWADELAQWLPRIALFRGMTMTEIRLLASICEEKRLAVGEEVGELGEIVGNVYLVMEGELAIHTPAGVETRRIHETEDYGLVSVVEPRRLVQPTTALVPTRLVRIPADALHALMESDSSIALTLWRNIARLQTFHFMQLVDRWAGAQTRDDFNPYHR